MSVHTVSVQGDPSFPCPDDRPILVVALEQGLVEPSTSRTGRLRSTDALSDCAISVG